MAQRGIVGGFNARPTQRDEVLSYMRTYGKISSFESYEELGITQLGARIFELKQKGYDIGKIRRAKISLRTGKKIHYDEYFLREANE
jgi:hypothetical protein